MNEKISEVKRQNSKGTNPYMQVINENQSLVLGGLGILALFCLGFAMMRPRSKPSFFNRVWVKTKSFANRAWTAITSNLLVTFGAVVVIAIALFLMYYYSFFSKVKDFLSQIKKKISGWFNPGSGPTDLVAREKAVAEKEKALNERESTLAEKEKALNEREKAVTERQNNQKE